MKALQIETGIIPGDAAANLPVSSAETEKRATGFLSMLAERFRESADSRSKQNTILVLPFSNFGPGEVAPLYGFALADSIAARLARIPSLVVRPSSSLMSVPLQKLDPLAIGQKLLVQYVLTGHFLRSENGFDLNWQLLDVPGQSVRAGRRSACRSFDLVAVQTEISNEVFATLQGMGQLQHSKATVRYATLRWQRIFPRSTCRHGRCFLLSCRAAAGGVIWTGLANSSRASGARREICSGVERPRHHQPAVCPTRSWRPDARDDGAARLRQGACGLDPSMVEANLYRVYMLLSRGEKESARHGIENLLQTAANDWNVHLVAGITLRLDGMYDEALQQFGRSLKLNPSNAPTIYNHRARVYHYQGQLELADEELQKGLSLEPRHPLLRTSLGYQHMRQGNMLEAIRFWKR